MKPKDTLLAFDDFLFEKGTKFTAIVIGGAALSLLGVITRETQDVDVLDPEVPAEVAVLAREFAERVNRVGETILNKKWLNNGPISLRKLLPKDWLKRTQMAFAGQAMTLRALGRSDLLKTKLFAFCDRDQDRDDCLKLNPTVEELVSALAWVQIQDQNPGWPAHAEASIRDLAKELGYGI